LESRIRPESQKIRKNAVGRNYDGFAFTLFALSIPMVNYALQTAGFFMAGLIFHCQLRSRPKQRKIYA
jgi:hypothetical protein